MENIKFSITITWLDQYVISCSVTSIIIIIIIILRVLIGSKYF